MKHDNLKSMENVLITGSETFGKYIVNPTKWLALSADDKIIADYKVHSLVLPSVVMGVENSGEVIVKEALKINAKAIISFGMASDVRGFRLERSGFNWIFNEKYLSKFENDQPLETTQPEKEQLQTDISRWDTEKMQALFAEADIPFESVISDDAGRYSCNSWIYRTLLAMKKQKLSIPYLFVHCSCTKEAIEFVPDFDPKKVLNKKEDMLKALEIVLLALR